MRQRARTLRQDQTPAEKAFWQAVRYDRCDGLRFVRQHVVGPYVLDFYCAALRLAVEIDGAIHDQAEVAQHDAARQQGLEEEGSLRFLRLSNAQVLSASPQKLRTLLRAAIARLS